LLVGVVQRIPRPKAPPWDRRVALGCLFRGLFVSGALPPGPRDLCRPSFCLRADRRFCGWAGPIVSAKPGLGGRSSFAAFFAGGLCPLAPLGSPSCTRLEPTPPPSSRVQLGAPRSRDVGPFLAKIR